MPVAGVRRKARERVLQFLFGLEFTRYGWEDALGTFWSMAPARPSVKQYAETVIGGVYEHLGDLDRDIDAALQNWSPERVGRVERNVLRIALFEMRFMSDVPPAVAINEAIELAKIYGAEDASRFVNGVLDRLRERK